jgi:pimeloyl-ACP methyl ester carboxylesterase
MRGHLSGVAVGVLSAALVLSSCSGDGDPAESGRLTTSSATVTDSAAAAARPLARFYGQELDWRDCHGGFECADVAVPVNYSRPKGRAIQLAVVRLPASGEARGSLLLNPGGPGASGITYALAAEYVVSGAVRKRYDIVGFDPRGVGDSAGVDCVTDPELDHLLTIDGSPDTPEEEVQVAQDWTVLGAGCLADRPGLTRHMSTRDAARDMDVLRAVLGDRRLNYLGKSYGTYLGITYAELFPERVGRVVLDGMIDPLVTGEQLAAGQAEGFHRAFRSFLADCVARASCPFDGTADEAQVEVAALLERTDSQPLRGTRGRPVTQALAVIGIAAALYDEGSWRLLHDALGEALAGEGRTLLSLADYYSDRGPDGRYTTNALEAMYAVNCLDRPEHDDLADYRAAAERIEASSPVFGAFIAWGGLGCRSWPIPPANEPHAVSAAGAKPIVVVGTTRDPATPYSWAVSAEKRLERGRLLTYVGDGHTAYRRGSRCIDAAVDAYLLRATLPAEGKRCR